MYSTQLTSECLTLGVAKFSCSGENIVAIGWGGTAAIPCDTHEENAWPHSILMLLQLVVQAMKAHLVASAKCVPI